MKIHRFYIDDLAFDKQLILEKKSQSDLYNQIVNVLHLSVEERVCLFNGADTLNNIYIIKDITNKLISLSLLNTEENRVAQMIAQKSKITLYLSLIKKDSFEFAISKACELGLHAIVPIISSRTQYKFINTERAGRIIREAAEQCGRANLLIINNPITFDQAIAQSRDHVNYACIIEKGVKIREGRESFTDSEVNVWLGPEGGWTDEEENIMRDACFHQLSLGPTIQRTETAVISSIAILQNF